jgi:hypothetical protein
MDQNAFKNIVNDQIYLLYYKQQIILLNTKSTNQEKIYLKQKFHVDSLHTQ